MRLSQRAMGSFVCVLLKETKNHNSATEEQLRADWEVPRSPEYFRLMKRSVAHTGETSRSLHVWISAPQEP